ncbi:MAG TPA: hypothetical protein VN259_03130 [Xanthomonadales bacterium]|nr:hypothetical protein [Xanthomonadales bacterium]
MNRRNMLVAAVGSVATLGSGVASALAGGSAGGLLAAAVSAAGREEFCALLPVSRATASAASTSRVQMTRFFPNVVGGRSQLAYFTVDLRLQDEKGLSRTVYAWQMRRRPVAQSHASGFRMQFEADYAEVVATIRPDGSRAPITWAGPVPRGTDSILVTPRLSTGRAPNAIDLRFDVDRQELSMADGSLRDFDAVLLHAS